MNFREVPRIERDQSSVDSLAILNAARGIQQFGNGLDLFVNDVRVNYFGKRHGISPEPLLVLSHPRLSEKNLAKFGLNEAASLPSGLLRNPIRNFPGSVENLSAQFASLAGLSREVPGETGVVDLGFINRSSAVSFEVNAVLVSPEGVEHPYSLSYYLYTLGIGSVPHPIPEVLKRQALVFHNEQDLEGRRVLYLAAMVNEQPALKGFVDKAQEAAWQKKKAETS